MSCVYGRHYYVEGFERNTSDMEQNPQSGQPSDRERANDSADSIWPPHVGSGGPDPPPQGDPQQSLPVRILVFAGSLFAGAGVALVCLLICVCVDLLVNQLAVALGPGVIELGTIISGVVFIGMNVLTVFAAVRYRKRHKLNVWGLGLGMVSIIIYLSLTSLQGIGNL